MKNLVSENHNHRRNAEIMPFYRNHRDFKNLMNHFWNYFDVAADETISDADWEPQMQVIETDESVDITAELPGIDEKTLDLQISSDGLLSLCGEKKNSSEFAEKGAYFSEISYGSFKRTLPLPWDLDYEHATANYTSGVLSIYIPKSQKEKQKFKKIDVQIHKN